MIKKASLIVLAICLLLVLLSPSLVNADNGLSVLDSSVETDFPSRLNFSLSAAGNADIIDIRLHYRVDRMVHAQVTSEVYLEFEPAATVEVDWDWDMRKTGGLPPGTNVEYWWTIADATGNRVETEPSVVRFDDHRYDWRSLTRGKITIYWYRGDDSFAQELMSTAQQALLRLAEYTGVEPEQPVRMYIYGSSGDLLGSMIYPQEWTGGVAFTRYSTVAIGIAPGSLDWGSRAIAHELTHLVIHQIIFNPYGYLPTWLDEGLAMNAEGELSQSYRAVLGKAVAEENLISVRSLASPFSAYAEESYLAYAQSYSLVKFLSDAYGQEKMFELLNTFKQGSSYDEALVRVYGFDMDGLDARWREYIASGALSVQMLDKLGISGVLAVTAAGYG